MSFEHPGDFFDWSQATPDGPAVPALKETFGLCGVKTAPEFSEEFLELPGFGDLASTVFWFSVNWKNLVWALANQANCCSS